MYICFENVENRCPTHLDFLEFRISKCWNLELWNFETLKMKLWKFETLRLWNFETKKLFLFSSKVSPSTPQHTDWHPCTGTGIRCFVFCCVATRQLSARGHLAQHATGKRSSHQFVPPGWQGCRKHRQNHRASWQAPGRTAKCNATGAIWLRRWRCNNASNPHPTLPQTSLEIMGKYVFISGLGTRPKGFKGLKHYRT